MATIVLQSRTMHCRQHYFKAIDELSTQLLIFATKFAGEEQAEKSITLPEILTFLRNLSEGQLAYFLQSSMHGCPSHPCYACYKFSKQMVIFYNEEAQSQAKLNHIMVLSIYEESLDGLDLSAIANEFVRNSEH